jgi:iron(III) transport system ATP-binding protein
MTSTAYKNGNNSDSSVTLEGINLSFGKTHVLKGIDLKIESGEFFAFLGPSGCGKTTLIRLIAGFESAQAGQVFIGKHEVSHLPPWQRNVGMVFQSYALWPHMTVRKNVAFGLEERRMPRYEINKRVDAAIDLVDLIDLADRRPSQLSGGQQQRVALARTVVIEPQVLLLDEPLSNLDAKLRVQMRRELRQLQQKLSLTTIFVTHDQEEANTTANRIAVINDGIIQQVGSPMDLYDQPANRFVADFLGTTNFIDGKLEESGNTTQFHADNGEVIPMDDTLDNSYRDRCSLVIRPQNVTITTGTEIEAADKIRLKGTISDKEFLGSTIRYRVNIQNDVLLADATHHQGQIPLKNGTAVNLYIKRNQVIIVGV